MVLFSVFYSTSQPAEAESTVLLITISAAIYLMILIIEIEDMRKLLLDRGDAARVFAVDHIADLVRQMKRFLIYNRGILNNIYGDVMINKTENVQIHKVDRAFNLHDIFLSHFITFLLHFCVITFLHFVFLHSIYSFLLFP